MEFQDAPHDMPIDGSVPAMSRDERMWGMLCHASALIGYMLPAVGNIVAPLVVWLLKKDEYPFVDDQGKEAINFQLSLLIYYLISFALCVVFIGFILLPIIGIFSLVAMIIAIIKANDGIAYRYPFTIRFI